jgi:hypothetical protein
MSFWTVQWPLKYREKACKGGSMGKVACLVTTLATLQCYDFPWHFVSIFCPLLIFKTSSNSYCKRPKPWP